MKEIHSWLELNFPVQHTVFPFTFNWAPAAYDKRGRTMAASPTWNQLHTRIHLACSSAKCTLPKHLWLGSESTTGACSYQAYSNLFWVSDPAQALI